MVVKERNSVYTQPNRSLKQNSGKLSVDSQVIDRPHNPERDSIVAVIPAYNEERFIGSVVLCAFNFAATVIVVDDGSTDRTHEISAAAGADVIQHKQNLGKGAAINSGFKFARQKDAEVIVLLDGDGQHSPVFIPEIAAPILRGIADMVIGSRYLGLTNDIPLYRKIGQSAVTFLTNSASGTTASDSWSGYRAFSKQAVDCIFFREGGWGVDPEFQFQAREHGLEIVEIPIDAIYEEKAKRNPIPHGVRTVNAIVRMVSQHRPLMFFGITGMILLLGGLSTGFWVYERFRTVHVFPAGVALLSVLLIVVGILTLFTGITLNSIRALLVDFSRQISKGSTGPDIENE
jgi:glycosyltransferase involved in cell wall biosynthesis